MKLVRTLPRYKCDFCKYRCTKHKMEKHEKSCFRNPNRMCQACFNTGVIFKDYGGTEVEEDCHYCKKFDPKILKEIEKREEIHYPDAIELYESRLN